MNFFAILALAVGLSMDATAVSAARGLSAPRLRPGHVATVALFFGGFQALMPLIGWGLGSWLGPWIAAWDHWIIFLLFGGIGAKMVHDSRGSSDEPSSNSQEATEESLFGWKAIVLLAIATSIDAFAAGITLPLLKAPVLVSVTTIGVTTAVLSAIGLVVGRRFGALLGRKLDVLGGIMLIALGAKTLIEHLHEPSR